MDIQKRDALLDVIRARGGFPTLVSLDEFFVGNDDGGSIWCNLPCAPRPDEVYRVLSTIREREEVAEVAVLVTQFDGGECWPFSDTVLFVTSRTANDIRKWLGADYAPDEVDKGASLDPRVRGKIAVPSGMTAVSGWWD